MHRSFLLLVAVFFVILRTSVAQDISKLGRPCTEERQRANCGESLVCLNSTCSYCTQNEQCRSIHVVDICQKYFFKNKTTNQITSPGGICTHKPLFPNINLYDILSTLFTFLAGVISSGGGIGGGGLFIPILTSAGQFAAHLAVPISITMIFGASLMTFFIQAFQRHPKADRPLIDYQVCLLLEPATLAGTVIGVFFNVMFPGWLILMLVLLLLIVTDYRMFKKAIEEWKKEGEEAKLNVPLDRNSETAPLVGTSDDSDDEELSANQENILDEDGRDAKAPPKSPTGQYSGIETPDPDVDATTGVAANRSAELEEILKSESGTPWFTLLVLVTCWVVIFLISLFKGAHGAPSVVNVEHCSPWYWFLSVIIFPIVFVMTFLIGWYLVRSHRRKSELNYSFHKGDVQYTAFNVFWYPLLCVFAGVMASLVGIGGGMIKSPLLMELGVPPSVAGASASFMILFTSSISTVQFIILGLLPWDYGLWFAANGFIAGLIGTLLIAHLVKKYNKQSIIVFSVAVAIAFAIVLMFGVGLYGVIRDIQDGVYMGFRKPC
ncbi:sulfite exporter TauE [Acrasis kona]|uniref:Sulfite exporter TauE n=1 Tax=Acrasis kona TaxID=1008807 RepID=A0AAW2ZFE6_9EUKA